MPPDYFEAAGQHRVVKTVTMEAEWDPSDPIGESLWTQAVAENHGFPQAHVAQAWLDADNVGAILEAQARIPLVRSVRHKPAAAPSAEDMVPGSPGSMSDPKWKNGYALLASHGLHFDLQVHWWHLYEAAELAAEFPDTLIILNHTGLPADRSSSGDDLRLSYAYVDVADTGTRLRGRLGRQTRNTGGVLGGYIISRYPTAPANDGWKYHNA